MVMYMKKSVKLFWKTVLISMLCCAVFVGVGYFYLQSSYTPAQIDTPSVPYYSSVPENAGVVFDIGGSKTFFYLNFEALTISVVYADFLEEDAVEIYGYGIDYTISTDYSVLAEIIDIGGGIDLDVNGEKLNCTGVQVVDILTTAADFNSLRREVTEKTLKALSCSSFQKSDFLYIIENSDTNLTVPDCYFWSDYFAELCGGARYVN